MSTMPVCPALIYRENGALPFAQMLVRPLSMLAGRSYNKRGTEFQPTLMEKIARVALAIIFLPLAIPAIAVSLLVLSLSSSHKEQCAALFASSSEESPISLMKDLNTAKKKEELEKAKTDAPIFMDEIRNASVRSSDPLQLLAIDTAAAKVRAATSFVAIVGVFQGLKHPNGSYTTSNPAFQSYMTEIKSKADREEMEEIVISILEENRSSPISQAVIDLTTHCFYLLDKESYELFNQQKLDNAKFREQLVLINKKYQTVFGHQHERLNNYLDRADAQ